jgi:hypothetical protein
MFFSPRRHRTAALFSAFTLLAAGSTLLMTGCGGGDSGSTSRSASTPFYLTDAPLTGATSVAVTLSRIEARRAGEGFVDTGLTYSGNLLELRNAETLLGEAVLPAGQFTGLRLTLASATITVNGVTHPLEPVTNLGNAPVSGSPAPASAATGAVGEALARKHGAGITVNPNGRSATLLINAPFSVAADGTGTPLLLDFNVAHSVVATGNGRYLLKPVIPVVHRNEAGEVTGEVELSPPPAEGAELPEVEVAALPAGRTGETQNATIADSVRQGGKFRIPALPRGTYNVTVTAQGYAPVTLPDVIITPGQKPDLGKITLRRP